MTGLVAAVLALGMQSSPPALCWIDRGARPDFGTVEQVGELQQALREGTPCTVWGVTWRVPSVPPRSGVFLWDAGREELVRLTVEAGTIYWEKWGGATHDRILVEDPSDGIDLANYLRGSGPVAVSDEAGELIRQGAKGRFDRAIKQESVGPVPATCVKETR